jgi:hypothetical protein
MKPGITGLVGPTINLSTAASYCRARGIPLHTLTRQDLDFFDIEIPKESEIRIESNMINLLRDKGFAGKYLEKIEQEQFYKNMQNGLQHILTQDINKMLCKHSLDVLNSEFGFNLDLEKKDFEDIYLKGRCELVTPGKEFG